VRGGYSGEIASFCLKYVNYCFILFCFVSKGVFCFTVENYHLIIWPSNVTVRNASSVIHLCSIVNNCLNIEIADLLKMERIET
jgi:hypothetical protein